VLLIEGTNTVLQAMSKVNQHRALKYLDELGCEVWLETQVSSYNSEEVVFKNGKVLPSKNLIWAAGIKGVTISGLQLDSINNRGRYIVDEYCKIKGCENIYAIGDVASMPTTNFANGHPQVAPVAIQMAQLLAENIQQELRHKPLKKFNYFDKGTMATVGRNRAVTESFNIRFGGFAGWLVWMALHLMLLVGFRNKVVVFINWLWNYINYDRNIRLIIPPYKRK
ncbi:MAG TPA: FAD-dependent oxidoreductase, partial [Bacteroidia bacterium]|nr:FAD-dependent oxidoreductase [Bacteroidia bacterium]